MQSKLWWLSVHVYANVLLIAGKINFIPEGTAVPSIPRHVVCVYIDQNVTIMILNYSL